MIRNYFLTGENIMYTNNNLYDLNENAEVVIRYSRGEKFGKGKVVKSTKTQLTIEYLAEDGRSFTERFSKSNGDQIGGKHYIGRTYGGNNGNGEYIPAHLMTYAEADVEIEDRKAKQAIETQKRDEQRQASQNRFNEIVKKTQNDRQSLTLIDEETQTYKIVVMSGRGNRMLGIFKVREDEYFDWDSQEYQKGFAFDLAYTGHSNSWGSRSTENAKTFEEGVDKVMYELYQAW